MLELTVDVSETDQVCKTSVFTSFLMWLSPQEDFKTFNHQGGFKLYGKLKLLLVSYEKEKKKKANPSFKYWNVITQTS
jgi:hypothetical protein